MFIKKPSTFYGTHLLVAGKQRIYSYVVEEVERGTITLYTSGDSLYMDSFNIHAAHQKQGWGTKMIRDVFIHFPNITNVWGYSTEENMVFWEKQTGFQYIGEGHDEMEGYLIFEILKTSQSI